MTSLYELRAWLTLPEAAGYLYSRTGRDIREDDFLRLALDGQLQLSVNLRCLHCLLLVMCTYPFAKKALTLHLARGESRERHFGCNLMQRKVLASSHQHLMAEAPEGTGVAVGDSDWRRRETVRDYFFIAAPLLEGLHLGLAYRRIA